MSSINIPQLAERGFQIGLCIALIPAGVTAVIACSRIILVNIIADIVVRVLTANAFTLQIYGVAFVEVPFLWKVSLVSAIAGGAIVAVSLTAMGVHALYERWHRAPSQQEERQIRFEDLRDM